MPPKPLRGRLVWEGPWDSRHRQRTMPSHKLIMRKMISGGHKGNPSWVVRTGFKDSMPPSCPRCLAAPGAGPWQTGKWGEQGSHEGQGPWFPAALTNKGARSYKNGDRMCMYALLCTAEPWPAPSLPIVGLTHQGELALTVPFQGTQVKKRGAVLAAAMACCTPQKLAQFLIAPLSLGPSSSAERTQMESSGGKGPQDSPHANHRAGNSRWDPDWPQGCPIHVPVLAKGPHRLCDILRSQPASTEAELLELQPPGVPLAIVTGTLPIFGQLPPGTTDEHLYKNNSESVPCGVQVS